MLEMLSAFIDRYKSRNSTAYFVTVKIINLQNFKMTFFLVSNRPAEKLRDGGSDYMTSSSLPVGNIKTNL